MKPGDIDRLIKRMQETQRIFDGPDCYTWREVFAWLPVRTITGKRVWWCKVYKQKFWAVWGAGFHMEPKVEYADLFDIIQDPYNEPKERTYTNSWEVPWGG